MRKYKLTKITKIFFVGSICLLLTTAGLNYSGVCVKQLSRLSDEDITDIAINRILSRQARKTFRTDGAAAVDEPIQYQTIDEFKHANPNCCEVSKYLDTPEGRIPPSFIDRITGFFRAFVTVKYKKRYQENQEILYNPAYEVFTFKNCLWKRT